MRRPGFTLIELISSLTLLTGLMVAVTSVLGLIGKRQAVIAKKYPDSGWHDFLAKQLRRDLENTRAWELKADSLKLIGYAGQDDRREQAALTECVVTYQVRSLNGKTWLLRQVEQLNRIDNAKPKIELVCGHVKNFQLPSVEPGRQPVQKASGKLPDLLELEVVCQKPKDSILIRFVR